MQYGTYTECGLPRVKSVKWRISWQYRVICPPSVCREVAGKQYSSNKADNRGMGVSDAEEAYLYPATRLNAKHRGWGGTDRGVFVFIA